MNRRTFLTGMTIPVIGHVRHDTGRVDRVVNGRAVVLTEKNGRAVREDVIDINRIPGNVDEGDEVIIIRKMGVVYVLPSEKQHDDNTTKRHCDGR